MPSAADIAKQNAGDSKSLFASKGMWGSILTVLTGLAMLLGYSVPEGTEGTIKEMAEQAKGIYGQTMLLVTNALALWGNITRSKSVVSGQRFVETGVAKHPIKSKGVLGTIIGAAPAVLEMLSPFLGPVGPVISVLGGLLSGLGRTTATQRLI